MSAPTQQQRALEILRQAGHHATSFQILEEGYLYWFDPQVEAVVAYQKVQGFWVAAGAPIAQASQEAAVAARFVLDAQRHGCRALFFSTDAAFLEALGALDHPFASLPIGEQPEWDPREYTLEGSKRRSLRAQVHRARNKGVRVRCASPREVALEPGRLRAQVELVLERWLAARKMSAMRFMVDLQPFTFPAERRYYIAEQGDRAVGFLAAIPVYARRGWFFEDVIRTPDAPNGTAELMIHTALEEACQEQDHYVTLGLAPLAGVEDGPGPARLLRWVMRRSWLHLGPLYQFQGLRAFKDRFRPERWRPQYLVVSPGPMNLRALHAVLLAFAGGGVLDFAVDTLRRLLERISLRRWSAALLALAGLLVPWTLLLAVADGERWFGDASIHRAWVVFDAGMVLALLWLGRQVRRGRPMARGLAFVLAGATLTDLVLTTAQATHLHRQPSGWVLFFVLAGMAGPALATLFLSLLAWAAPLPLAHSRS